MKADHRQPTTFSEVTWQLSNLSPGRVSPRPITPRSTKDISAGPSSCRGRGNSAVDALPHAGLEYLDVKRQDKPSLPVILLTIK